MKNLMGKVNMKMRENRRNGRKALKGFTLVEIIVVLVILAILAAAMIPALTGYIDKAKNRTLVAEARNAVTAAQTLCSEAYGLGTLKTDGKAPVIGAKNSKDTGTVIGLSEVPGTISDVLVSNKGKVVGLVYVAQSGTAYVEYHEGTFDDPVEIADASKAPKSTKVEDKSDTFSLAAS